MVACIYAILILAPASSLIMAPNFRFQTNTAVPIQKRKLQLQLHASTPFLPTTILIILLTVMT